MQASKRIIICFRFILFLCFALTILTACKSKKVSKASLLPRHVKVIELNQHYRRLSQSYHGIVEAGEVANLSFQVPGEVVMVHAKLGQAIAKGTILAQLDPATFRMRAKAASAKYIEAKAKVELMHVQYKAESQLVSRRRTSLLAHQKAKAMYEAALAAQAVAKTNADIAKENLAKTTLLAPFAGKIAKKDIKRFQHVNSGQILFVLESTKHFDVKLQVPLAVTKYLRTGDAVKIYLPYISADKVWPGKITEIGIHSKVAQAFPVTVTFNHFPDLLRSGILADVRLDLSRSDDKRDTTFQIPVSAIIPDLYHKHKAAVFLFDPSTQRVHKQLIKVDNINGDVVQVIAGLKPNDQVVVTGTQFLHQGEQVKRYQAKD